MARRTIFGTSASIFTAPNKISVYILKYIEYKAYEAVRFYMFVAALPCNFILVTFSTEKATPLLHKLPLKYESPNKGEVVEPVIFIAPSGVYNIQFGWFSRYI